MLPLRSTPPSMGPPETTIWEYPGEDASWREEFAHFVDCVEAGSDPLGTLDDALAALNVVERVYGLCHGNERRLAG